MSDRKSTAAGLTPIDQLELRIRVLEQEIPFYSNKAAEAMVKGIQDNPFKVETEVRLEELAKAKEELQKLQAEKLKETAVPPPPPPQPQASPPAVPYAASPAYALMAQQAHQQTSHRSLQPHPNQSQANRKQNALDQAKRRAESIAPQDAVFLCSFFLEYTDLVACVCVSKYWNQRFRRSPGWRRVVLNLEKTLYGHIGRITALSTYESYIVSGSADGKIKFWDHRNLACAKTLNITPSPAHKYVHPKLKELREQRASSGVSTSYAASEEEEFAEYPLAVTALLTVDKCVLIGAEDGRLIVWMAHAPEKREFDMQIHSKALNCLLVTDDYIFTASADGKVSANNRRHYPFSPQAPAVWNAPIYGTRKHDQGGVTCLAYAGGNLFSGGYDGKIYIWNMIKGVLDSKRDLKHNRLDPETNSNIVVEHKERITSMCGLRDRLYTASWDGTIKLWNATNFECLRDVPVLPIGICWSLAIRHDSNVKIPTLVGGVRDSDICIMDWSTLEVLSTCEANSWAYKLDQHTQWVRCILAFSDGRIVSGSDDWNVKVWNIRGSSTTRSSGIFMGLPMGPLSQEDADIIMFQMSKSGQQVTLDYLQGQKLIHDKALKEKLVQMTPEQRAQHENYFNKSREGWNKVRERRRRELQGDSGKSSSTVQATSSTMSLSTPASTSATPAGTVATPAATLATPAATLATPAATLATPAATVATPAATVTSPAATTASPATTVIVPSQTTVTASEAAANAPVTSQSATAPASPANTTNDQPQSPSNLAGPESNDAATVPVSPSNVDTITNVQSPQPTGLDVTSANGDTETSQQPEIPTEPIAENGGHVESSTVQSPKLENTADEANNSNDATATEYNTDIVTDGDQMQLDGEGEGDGDNQVLVGDDEESSEFDPLTGSVKRRRLK